MTTLRNHDYKKERLHKLGTELLTKKGKILYDVVLLQEFFGAFYSDRHREYFVDLMKQVRQKLTACFATALINKEGGALSSYLHTLPKLSHSAQLGYKFHGKSSRSFFSSFPSLWANAGLAIFSPYPVKDIVARPFKNQSFYDRWMAARGIISATVSLPSDKGGDMRFFSVHVGPTVYVLSSFDFIPVFIKQMADKFALQIGEVQDEITRQAKKHNLRGVIGGDFNVRVNTEPYKFLKDRLEDIGYVCKSTEFELPGAKMTANPPGEYLLTGGTREAKILDYFFSDLPGGSSEVANMTVSHDAFNMNSDHAPIILRF